MKDACDASAYGVRSVPRWATPELTPHPKIWRYLQVSTQINYRKLAFDHYKVHICAFCGFGIEDILEVSHLDGDRTNNKVENLVILCPNCHKMHDIELIPTEIIIRMRDTPKHINWDKRMHGAIHRAWDKRHHRNAGFKAAETKRRNQDASVKDS